MTLKESKPSEYLPHFFSEDFPDFEESYYFNARWYDPTTGRFLTEDPVKDGLLWYAYVNNNPLKYIDPTGLRAARGANADDEDDTWKADEELERRQQQKERDLEKYYEDKKEDKISQITKKIDESSSMDETSELLNELESLNAFFQPEKDEGSIIPGGEIDLLEEVAVTADLKKLVPVEVDAVNEVQDRLSEDE